MKITITFILLFFMITSNFYCRRFNSHKNKKNKPPKTEGDIKEEPKLTLKQQMDKAKKDAAIFKELLKRKSTLVPMGFTVTSDNHSLLGAGVNVFTDGLATCIGIYVEFNDHFSLTHAHDIENIEKLNLIKDKSSDFEHLHELGLHQLTSRLSRLLEPHSNVRRVILINNNIKSSEYYKIIKPIIEKILGSQIVEEVNSLGYGVFPTEDGIKLEEKNLPKALIDKTVDEYLNYNPSISRMTTFSQAVQIDVDPDHIKHIIVERLESGEINHWHKFFDQTEILDQYYLDPKYYEYYKITLEKHGIVKNVLTIEQFIQSHKRKKL